MFTGIVEAAGTIESVKQVELPGPRSVDRAPLRVLSISGAGPVLNNCSVGDRLNVNGVCVKISAFDEDTFQAHVQMPQMWEINIYNIESGAKVHLERPVSGASRFGGHFVQGRVDATASIVYMGMEGSSLGMEGSSLKLQLALKEERRLKEEVLANIMTGGYIALDGVSVTIASVKNDQFEVMIPDYPREKFAFRHSNAGDIVNVELDLSARLVGQHVAAKIDCAVNDLVSDFLYQQVEHVLEDMLAKTVADELQFRLEDEAEALIPRLVREVKRKVQAQLDAPAHEPAG